MKGAKKKTRKKIRDTMTEFITQYLGEKLEVVVEMLRPRLRSVWRFDEVLIALEKDEEIDLPNNIDESRVW